MLTMMMVLTDDQSDLITNLYKNNYRLFYSVAFNILHSEQDAEDAVQASFEKITRKIERFSDMTTSQIRSYCVVMVENYAISKIRRDNRIDHLDSMESLPICDNHSPEEIAVNALKIEGLKKGFSKLSDDEKELLRLRYYNELSYKQIAEIYDITIEAAKKRVQRAIKELRSFLIYWE